MAAVVACGVIGGFSSGAVMAQGAGPAAAPAAGASRVTQTVSGDQYAADAMLSFVLGLVRNDPDPSPRSYRSVAMGLRVVGSLVPSDAEIVRLEIQAWDSAGDLDRATEATERLLRLDPKDTVAQLRVINARIRRLPDADARLAVYDRILSAGATGQSAIPEEVRSRLALDAALLAREIDADEIRFIDYLTAATTLDISNKEAAVLFGTSFLERTSDPSERVDLLTNIVLADPLDPASQATLASELLKYGAFSGAKRWYAITQRTRLASGMQADEDISFSYYLSLWHDEGPLAAREAIATVRRSVLQDMARQRAKMQAQGEDPGPELPPILPYRLELLSMGIDAALRDRPRLEAAVQRLEIWAAMTQKQVLEGGQRMRERAETEEDVKQIETALRNAMGSLQVELLYAYLMAGVEMDKAEKLVDSLAAWRDRPAEEIAAAGGANELAAVLDERAEQRFRGWIALHRGLADQAHELLDSLAEQGDASARLALGTLAEQSRQMDQAQLHYAKLVQADSSTMLAAIAMTRLENMLGRPIAPTQQQQALNQVSVTVLPWLEDAISEPRLISAITARFTPTQIGALGRPMLEIRLRNASRIPLGVGQNRPINPELMLLPRLSVPGLPSQQQAAVGRLVAPEVVSAARRLRLRPNEEIVIVVNTGRGLTGHTMRQLMSYPANLRLRVIQNFVMGNDGTYAEGPLAASAQSDILTRTALEIRESAETLADRLLFAEGETLLAAIQTAAFRLSLVEAAVASDTALTPEQQRERDVLREALLERAPGLSVSEARLAAGLAMQYLPLRDEWGKAYRIALGGVGDPVTDLMLVIAAQAEHDDASLAHLAGRDDDLGRFAAALRAMREPSAVDGAQQGAGGRGTVGP